MPILVDLDVPLAKRKMTGKTFVNKVEITEKNHPLLRTGRVKGVRFATLEKICEILDCQSVDIFRYEGHRRIHH